MSEQVKKQSVFSGIQPTGVFTLGNYAGALKNWVNLQEKYNCVYCVVDLHAITIRHDPKDLRENTLRAYALLLACGIDPDKSTVFVQSHVPTHSEGAWLLGCFTPYGELGRMTQFKEKSSVHADNINAGLFTYPVLQVADILLYDASYVPVGEDQRQHLELTRNVAIRFNGIYGDTFVVPEPYILKEGGKVMSLQDPTKKMSKSDSNPKAFIALLDPPDTIIKKFKSAVTDSDSEIVYREGKDGVNNLMSIYSIVTDKSLEDIECEFAGKGYGDFKLAVGEAVANHLKPVQDEFARLMNDRAYLESCCKNGAEKASAISSRILAKAYEKVGLLAR